MNLVKKFAYTSMALMLALGISACGNNEKPAEETKKTETTETAEKKDDKAKETETGDIPTLTYLNIGTHKQVQKKL